LLFYLYFASCNMTTIEQFYKQAAVLFPNGVNKEIGHFNVFKIDDFISRNAKKGAMPYDRRSYYKISLIKGRNRAEYADKVIDIAEQALLFGTPRIPYNYQPLDDDQGGYFCIFTDEFMTPAKSGVVLEDLPLFQPGGYPILQLSAEESDELTGLFGKIFAELASDYMYKYDLLRNYVLELIHYGQKLRPVSTLNPVHTASNRVTSLFIELLERQFPITSPRQQLSLRSAKDYADRLAVHVNHLNKVLKETTGKTTTEIISGRVLQEAKTLLKQTDWNISEIAWSLGFEQLSNFSNFFRKHTAQAPHSFRA
jgi:AraC family transcriptional activator of pobA